MKQSVFKGIELGERLPHGAIVAIADLSECLYMAKCASDSGINRKGVDGIISILSVSELEESVGDWKPGRFAWKLENIKSIEPIYCNNG